MLRKKPAFDNHADTVAGHFHGSDAAVLRDVVEPLKQSTPYSLQRYVEHLLPAARCCKQFT